MGALGRWKRPSVRLTALVAVGIALAIQVVPPFGSAQAATHTGVVHAVVPVTGVDVQVSLTGPQEAAPGSAFTDSILLTNAGTLPATSVAFHLAPPVSGATYAVNDPGVTCDPGWHCTLADLSPGAQRLVSLTVTTANPLGDGDAVTPGVTASTSATDVDPSNDHATFSTTLSALSHLALTMKRTSGAVIPGGPVTYRMTVTNSGPSAAISPAVAVDPPRYPFSKNTLAKTNTDGSCAVVGRTADWVCGWPTIPAGGTRVVSFALTTSDYLVRGSSFVTYAAANAANTAGVTSTSQLSTLSDVSTRPTDVSVTTYSTPKVKPDTYGAWKVTVTNHGPHRAHGVVLVETVPKGFSWTDNTAGRVSVTRAPRTLRFDIGNLEVGESQGLVGKFRYPSGTTLTWSSKIEHTDPDSKASNNADTSSTRVLGPVVKAVTTSTTSSGTAVSTTGTTSSTSSSTSVGSTSDSAEPVVSTTSSSTTSTGAEKVLADTGGPALRLPLLGFTLVLLGAVSSASSRRRRPAPRHRAWISPYA
jgi:uncharacterized repeat protein (TIGR01451 family)